jgi:hypothetical protein
MAKAGMALAVIGGLLILLAGLGAFANFTPIGMWYITGAAGAGLGVLFGLITLIGGWWSKKPGKESMSGIIAVIFSLLGFLVGGGWWIGSILGLVGGILIWMKR